MIKIKTVSEEQQAFIRKHFSYDPHTGAIKRDYRKNYKGYVDKFGYLRYKVNGEVVLAHRIAWFLYYGKFPDGELDHINRCKTDNRITNLREATRSMQCYNRDLKPNPRTGERGISILPFRDGKPVNKPYYMGFRGKTRWFYTLEEAKQFRIDNGLPI